MNTTNALIGGLNKMDQIWQNITSSDWMAIVSYIVQAICFILTCIILIQSKVNTIKLQAENQKLQSQANLSDVEYKAKELKLREEYNAQMETLRKQISAKVDDNQAKENEKLEAQTKKISGDISAAQASIDQIINSK
jgi:F0F1-type ATP synthase membrane subunit b/b'